MQITSALRATVAALSIAIAAALPSGAGADELTDIYARIIANPVDTELNLQYAMVAEGRGEYRKALAAYERILVNDPGNEAARRGIQRVRRIIEPAVTLKTVELGAMLESNPLHAAEGGEGDIYGYGRFGVRDERPMGAHRWRTLFNAYGELHARDTELNYGSLTAETGPLIDLPGTWLTFRPGIGAGAAAFDGRFYYWDLNASAGLEGYLQGAYQWARLRAGYRQYDPSFTTHDGFYADLTGKLSFQNVIHDRDVFSLSPRLRWSGIEGEPENGAEEFAPGLYVEAGNTFAYSKLVTDTVTAEVDFRISQRWYEDIGMGPREDLLLSPGASLIFSGLFGVQTDLRLAYRYEWNDSNDDDHDWQNHSLKIGVSARR